MDVSKKIPVKHVTLYSNGISIIERQGSVPVKEGILYTLNFDLNDLNNVLRTILVIDADGGAVKKIQYELPENGFEVVEDRFRISPNKAFSSIIEGSINEETVVITSGGEEITGCVLGYETNGHLIITNDSIERSDELVLLNEENKIIRIPVKDVDQLIPNKNVIKKIRQSQTSNKTEATIGWELDPGKDGKETHDITIRYLEKLEKWDMIYHIHELNGKFILYGWGVIRNPTEDDWKEVSVGLEVGSAPESKIQIVKYNFNNTEVNSGENMVAGQKTFSYRYHISEPLTIPKMSSVLVPIIQETVEGTREYFWNTSESRPILFLKIMNNQDLAWGPGSVVYWEKAQFTSEGRIEFTPISEEARIKIGHTSDVNVKKEQEKIESNKEEPNGEFVRKYFTKFKVENLRSEPVILWINDKAPENAHPEIMNATHNPKKDFEGNFIWLITLGPKEKNEISFSYAYK
ncbi:MAG: DUF4139 domain-containing protein [Candidatus Jordarchaeum sp.]|uniref:DUF4139 domain-containing protein n=1 Tax=Candidatus Jordarchaeum sp. TaxID=2823881 RepID=UPI00404A042D